MSYVPSDSPDGVTFVQIWRHPDPGRQEGYIQTVRDYERLPASHEAMITWAMIALMVRRLTYPAHLSNTH